MDQNKKSSPPLTIIILNHNVRPFLAQCLKSILKDPQSKNWKIIVVDNASTDDSIIFLKKFIHINPIPPITLIKSNKNLGFSAGNNLAVKHITTPYTLFLNPDTLVPSGAIPHMLKFMEENPQVGAATCRVELPNGQLDDSCHRGFPTPWNAFCHFSGLAKLFPKSKIFTGYSLSYLLPKDPLLPVIQSEAKNPLQDRPGTKKPPGLDTLDNTNNNPSPGVDDKQSSPHPIDALNGAFLLLHTKIGQQLHWWDTDYFWYGEDLDFCYRIKNLGHQIYYIPDVKIIHYKGASSGLYQTATLPSTKKPKGLHPSAEEPRGLDPLKNINKNPSPGVDGQETNLPSPSRETKIRSARASTQAMRTFYRKHYQDKYPRWLTWLVLTAINLIQSYRLRKYSG